MRLSLNRLLNYFAALLLSSCALAFTGSPAMAQSGPPGSSYITPFPPDDVYRVLVIGDGLGEGLMWALQDELKRDARVRVERRRWRLDSLLRSDINRETKKLQSALKREKISLVVVMFGIRDRVTVRDRSGRRQAVGSDYWRKIYASYADKLMKALRLENRAVYWVGLPPFRGPRMHAAAQIMNDLVRERAYLNGVRFIDSFRGFMNASGGYTDYGPDLTGKMRRLREKDGRYLTAAGNRKLAHFANRVLKRDLTEAKSARLVPLAGSPDEQRKINPQAAKKADNEEKSATLGETASNLIASLTAKVTGSGKEKKKSKDGGQPAENGKVTLQTKGDGGSQDAVTLEILRPAIPASVIALVTRKQSPDRAARLGETLVDRIPGGLNILSSVTPVSGTRGTKQSPTRAPFFRVLVKGERVKPRKGRADDFSWPRPTPPPPLISASMKRTQGNASGAVSIPLPRRNPMRYSRQRTAL